MKHLTRKHFEAIAAKIAKIADPNDRAAEATRQIDTLKQSNPRFDPARFAAACNV